MLCPKSCFFFSGRTREYFFEISSVLSANVRLTCRRGKRDQGERLGPAFGHEFNRLLAGIYLYAIFSLFAEESKALSRVYIAQFEISAEAKR
jgi:hypothetical protein